MKAKGDGRIVFVNSGAANNRAPQGLSAYAASKAALAALVRSIALENGRYGIRCNGVHMGVIDGGNVRPWFEAMAKQKGQTIEALSRRILRRQPAAALCADAQGMRRLGAVPGLRPRPLRHRPGHLGEWRRVVREIISRIAFAEEQASRAGIVLDNRPEFGRINQEDPCRASIRPIASSNGAPAPSGNTASRRTIENPDLEQAGRAGLFRRQARQGCRRDRASGRRPASRRRRTSRRSMRWTPTSSSTRRSSSIWTTSATSWPRART